MNFDLSFYKDKKVLITGHTGFKGAWMTVMLANLGAKVIGYSSCSKKDIKLFDLCDVKKQIIHIKGDVRDLNHMFYVFEKYKPEIVIHMAAQPIVRERYKNPVETYYTNVMGTVNVCEAVRRAESVKSFLNVTTDKVYENQEWEWGYRENDPLDGYDPYSNSKSCSELVTHSYKNSFFCDRNIAVSTSRAGNVIGGGDFAIDRIIPDCIRAVINRNDIVVRNPYSIRPYQHVLEPIYAYLMIAAKQYEDHRYQSWYNVGPDDSDYRCTGELVDMFVECWGEGIKWVNKSEKDLHEANILKLDCSNIKSKLGWKPRWHLKIAMDKIVEWSKVWISGGNVREVMDKQISEFISSDV